MTTCDEHLIDLVQAMYARIWDGHACPECRIHEHCDVPLDILGRTPEDATA